MSGGKGLKMCRACRGLIDTNAVTCPLCGAEGHYAKRASVSLSGLSGMWTVNNVLILTNLAIYALVLLYQNNIMSGISIGQETDPLTPNWVTLYLFGSVDTQSIMEGSYWRLITACFLHGGLLHIGFNSFALFRVGQMAEEAYGGAKYLCLYLVCGIAGYVAVILLVRSPAIGASGAVFGLIGAMAVYGYKRADSYGRSLKSYMVQWIVIGVVMSFLPGVSWQAHFGGLAAGAIFAFFLTDVSRTKDSLKMVRIWQAGAGLCVVLVLGSFVCGTLFARKATD